MTLLFLLAGCQSADAVVEPEAMDLPAAPGYRVELAELDMSAARAELSFPAEVQADRDSLLAAPLGGYVEAVLVETGSHVDRGDVIARVDVSSRRFQHEIAEAQALQAEAEWARIQKIGDGASASQKLAAETNAKVARANAELARVNLARSVVTAPFSGEIASVNVEVGEVAAPGSPVARLVGIDQVELMVSLSDRDMGMLHVGDEVVFRAQSLPSPYTGSVTHVGTAADNDTRTFLAQIAVDNPEKLLLPGMIGRIAVSRSFAEEAIVIPQDWLITHLDETGVYVAQDGRALWRTVELGAYIRDQVVVSEGLSPGDRVVTKGARDVSAGDPLIVVREGRCCTDGRVDWE